LGWGWGWWGGVFFFCSVVWVFDWVVFCFFLMCLVLVLLSPCFLDVYLSPFSSRSPCLLSSLPSSLPFRRPSFSVRFALATLPSSSASHHPRHSEACFLAAPSGSLPASSCVDRITSTLLCPRVVRLTPFLDRRTDSGRPHESRGPSSREDVCSTVRRLYGSRREHYAHVSPSGPADRAQRLGEPGRIVIRRDARARRRHAREHALRQQAVLDYVRHAEGGAACAGCLRTRHGPPDRGSRSIPERWIRTPPGGLMPPAWADKAGAPSTISVGTTPSRGSAVRLNSSRNAPSARSRAAARARSWVAVRPARAAQQAEREIFSSRALAVDRERHSLREPRCARRGPASARVVLAQMSSICANARTAAWARAGDISSNVFGARRCVEEIRIIFRDKLRIVVSRGRSCAGNRDYGTMSRRMVWAGVVGVRRGRFNPASVYAKPIDAPIDVLDRAPIGTTRFLHATDRHPRGLDSDGGTYTSVADRPHVPRDARATIRHDPSRSR